MLIGKKLSLPPPSLYALQALELSPRLGSSNNDTKEMDGKVSRRGFGGTSAPATLEGERPASMALSPVAGPPRAMGTESEAKISSPSQRDSSERETYRSPNHSEFRTERPESSCSPKISQKDLAASDDRMVIEEGNQTSSVTAKSYKGPFPNKLRPLSRPRDSMLQCLQLLDNPEWEKTMQGLQTLVCLLKFHTMLPMTYLHSVMVLLAKQVRNLRSQVSRAACMVSSELFSTLGRAVENDLDELAGPLFHRSADTNKFLRADCNTALDSMVEAVSPSKAVSVIVTKGASHQNAIVRTTAARLLYAVVSKIGTDRVMMASQDMRDKIILTGANLLTEGSLDTRCHAKQIFRCLSKNENFNHILQEVLPASLLRHIRKTLQNLK
ncbi:Uncharacterized protein GBIM_16912 [Gryllus bimaculatus]|nr:Uncharacterized protein GBIM_16912 [Gryllus bimaculatus]